MALEPEDFFLEELVTERRYQEGHPSQDDEVGALFEYGVHRSSHAPEDSGIHEDLRRTQNRDVKYVDSITVDANRGEQRRFKKPLHPAALGFGVSGKEDKRAESRGEQGVAAAFGQHQGLVF